MEYVAVSGEGAQTPWLGSRMGLFQTFVSFKRSIAPFGKWLKSHYEQIQKSENYF